MSDSPDTLDATSSETPKTPESQSEKEADNVSVEPASLSSVADSPSKCNRQKSELAY